MHIWGPLAMAALAACTFAAGAIFLVLLIHHEHEIDRKLCQSAVNNRVAVRVTWLAAEHLVITPNTTVERQERLNAFFNAVLKPIPPLECINNNPVPRGSH